MHYSYKVFLILSLFFGTQLAFSQNLSKDSTLNYLKSVAVKLLEPHVDMNYSYTVEEIENIAPDMKVKLPQLKDTTELLTKLKGDYSDWKTFVEIAKIYRRYNKEQSAYPYFVNAYNLIASEIQKDSLNGKYYSDMAKLYLDAGNQEYAQAYLNLCYQFSPGDSMVLKLLPMYLAISGDIEKAEQINELSMKTLSDIYDPYVNLLSIEIFKVMYDSTLMQKLPDKNIEDIFDFKKLKTLAETHKEDKAYSVLYNVGKLFALYIKYVNSSDFLNEKPKLNPGDEKELKLLKKFFGKAVKNNAYKNKHILYKSLGFIYLLERDWDNSINNFRKMMDYWPKNRIANDYDLIFAVQYFLKKDTLAALNTMEEKISSNEKYLNNNVADYVRLGDIYLQLNAYEKAKNAYEKALSFGKSEDAYLGLSVLQMMDMNFQEANKYINFAYDLNKNYYLTYALFGVLTLMADDKQQADQALKQALQLKPDNSIIKELYKQFFGN